MSRYSIPYPVAPSPPWLPKIQTYRRSRDRIFRQLPARTTPAIPAMLHCSALTSVISVDLGEGRDTHFSFKLFISDCQPLYWHAMTRLEGVV